jgi:anaerobic selenocysteine-containing dehydrogenase
MPLDILPSVCPHDCPSTCALEVERLDSHKIGRVRGAADNSYTLGVVCAKTARYAERVHHPDRLTRPLRRRGAKGSTNPADWAPISWDDALDLLAERLTRAAQAGGTEAVWPNYYAGTMGLVMRDGINRLRHVMRWSGQHSTFCNNLVDAGWIVGTGAKAGVDPREMQDADLIVMWGGNPVATQVNVMTHVSLARKNRGARFIVVDPYRTGTAEAADLHLMVRPGTDGALACAVMQVLLAEGYADREYLGRLTDFGPDVERHLMSRTPDWAAAITGIPAETIVAFAREYGRTKRSFIRVGYGFSRSRNGAAQVHAVTCLPGVTGAWKYKGGGAFFAHRSIYHWNKTMIEGLDHVDPTIRILEQGQVGRILTGDREALKGGPPVTALFIQNTNPMVVAPESRLVREGFARDDLFTCVHEQFLTETAAMADLVLPATTFLEHDDLYQAGGHPHIQVARKVIEPHGESRNNHEVLQGLARRLGATHPGFEMTPWELIDWTLKNSGWPDAETVFNQRWLDVQPQFEASHFLDGFGTPDRKFRFKPDWSSVGATIEGMPTMPDHWNVIEATDDEHPFRLVTAPARQYLNTTFTETPGSKKREGRPSAKIHPEDCARLGLGAGDRVRLGNRRGSVVVHVELFDGVQPGVIVVESVWPNAAFEEGIGINVLVGGETLRPNGGVPYHDSAVWVRPA